MEPFTFTASFVLFGNRAEVTLQIDPPPMFYVSFTSTYDGAGGQIVGMIRENAGDNADVLRLCDLWNAFHLKRPPFSPELVAGVQEARSILERLNGTRIGQVIESGADDFEEAEFSNTADVIDSRDVIRRIEYLRDYLSDLNNPTPESYDPETDPRGNRADAVQELANLVDLEEQASAYASDWRYGETLIHEDHFEDYAQELAEDCGMINKDARWPNNHIDWSSAAQELKNDYTEVSFNGQTYYIR